MHDGSYEEGPDLPIDVSGHSAIKINVSTSMLIGGETNDGYSRKTWFFSHLTGEWIDGPTLSHSRAYHSLGLLTDSVTNEQFIVVSGGYNFKTLKSVEILDKEGVAWKTGNLLYLLIKINL